MPNLKKATVFSALVISSVLYSHAQQSNKKEVDAFVKELVEQTNAMCLEVATRYKKNTDECKRRVGKIFLECSEKNDSHKCISSELEKYLVSLELSR